MIKAVITGDVIQSGNLTPKQRELLHNNIGRALKLWDKSFKMKSEIFQGDSFQCLLNPMEALRVGLLIKTHIRSLNPSELYDIQNRKNPAQKKALFYTKFMFDARIAIGIGEVGVPAEKLASSYGEAFTLSGHLLDDIKNTKQTIAIASDDMFSDELETESVLLDAIISKTSALQCRVLNLKLLGDTETQIAGKLNIAQSAVNQRSTSGAWNAIETMVNRFEDIYNDE